MQPDERSLYQFSSVILITLLHLSTSSQVLMEAYLWLPPGSYPDMSELLCHMACDIFRSLASSTPTSSSSSSSSSDRNSDLGGSSSSSGSDAPESSLLETLVNPEDNVLGMMSSYYCASNQVCDCREKEEITHCDSYPANMQDHMTRAIFRILRVKSCNSHERCRPLDSFLSHRFLS